MKIEWIAELMPFPTPSADSSASKAAPAVLVASDAAAPRANVKAPSAFARLAWKLFFRRGAGEDADHMGVTPFMRNCREQSAQELARQLAQSPEKALERCSMGRTALMQACDSRREDDAWMETIQTLLKASDAQAKDVHGKTALSAACAAGNARVAKKVLRAAPPKKADRAGLVHSAAYSGSVEVLRLVEPFHDPAHRDAWGFTALMRAMVNEQEAACAFLAPISDWAARDKNGKTPLSWAAISKIGNGKMLAALLPALPARLAREQAGEAIDLLLKAWASRPAHDKEKLPLFDNFAPLLSIAPAEIAEAKMAKIRAACCAPGVSGESFNNRHPKAFALLEAMDLRLALQQSRAAQGLAQTPGVGLADAQSTARDESAPPASAMAPARRPSKRI